MKRANAKENWSYMLKKMNSTNLHLPLNSLFSIMHDLQKLILHRLSTPIIVVLLLLTHQLDDLDENPVIGGGGHEFEEEGGQRQVVLGISASQLTDDVHCCRLDTWATIHAEKHALVLFHK